MKKASAEIAVFVLSFLAMVGMFIAMIFALVVMVAMCMWVGRAAPRFSVVSGEVFKWAMILLVVFMFQSIAYMEFSKTRLAKRIRRWAGTKRTDEL